MSEQSSDGPLFDLVESAVEYRDIPGFPGYRAGDDGSVWSLWKKVFGGYRSPRWVIGDEWKRLKPGVTGRYGHLQV